MYSRSLFAPDFAKWFFVRYAQIYEAYVERTLIKFVYSWRKNSRKSGCKGDSESTFILSTRIKQSGQTHIFAERFCSIGHIFLKSKKIQMGTIYRTNLNFITDLASRSYISVSYKRYNHTNNLKFVCQADIRNPLCHRYYSQPFFSRFRKICAKPAQNAAKSEGTCLLVLKNKRRKVIFFIF